MSLAKPLPCADLGSAFCPCALAAAGQCTYCTRLRGEDRCACDWAGICVLLHGGAGPGPHSGPQGAVRRARRARISGVRMPAGGVCELWVQTPARPCAQLGRPGTFVLVRRASSRDRFDVPLTVAGVAGDRFRLIFKVAGPKTRTLSSAVRGENVTWRGPYHSGLLGLRRLGGGPPAAAVIVARGLGQAAALPVVTHLAGRGINCAVLVDPGGFGGAFARAELEGLSGNGVADIRCMKPEGATVVAETVRRISGGGAAGQPVRRILLVSCGSDPQHRWLGGLRPALMAAAGGLPVDYAAGNNSLVVCGEGVCGACVRRLPGGERFRGCKADAPPELLWPPDRARQQPEGRRTTARRPAGGTAGA